MKRFLIFCFCLIAVNTSAQKVIKSERASDHSIHVIGDTFEGVVFSKTAAGFLNRGDKKFVVFTPSANDILSAEQLLPGLLNSNKPGGETAYGKTQDNFIKNNLKKYYRQYWGYINPKGEKIICIHCILKSYFEEKSSYDKKMKKRIPDWQTREISIDDGGTLFWQIKINLNTQKQLDYYVNGLA